MRSRRIVLPRIVLALISVCFALASGEVLLAWFAPQVRRIPRIWQFDALLGWAHVPHARGIMVTPEFKVDITINGAGLRDRDFSRTPESGTWRLMALGDSFVEGWGVEIEESVTKQLERLLQARMRPQRVEVMNLGVAGYGTDQELLFFERFGRNYHPDDVLVFFYANDLWNNASRVGIGSESGYKPFFRLEPAGGLSLAGVPVPRLRSWDEDWERRRPWRHRLGRYLERNWNIYALAKHTLFPPLADLEQRQEYYSALYGADLSGRWQPQWELSGRLLQALNEAVMRAGGRLHVIQVPAIPQIEDRTWNDTKRRNQLQGRFDRRKPDQELASFAARYGLSYVDLYPAFRRQAAHEVLYYRDSHWNRAGHALAAARIADFLIKSAPAGGAMQGRQ